MIDTVKMYCFEVEIEGQRFCGQIPALSFEHVAELVPGATAIGELIETRPIGLICSICTGDMIQAEPIPQPRDDEWSEVIE